MSENKTKNVKRNFVSYREIAVRIILLVLTVWIAMSGFVTWAVAGDMYRQIELQIPEYWTYGLGREVSGDDIPGSAEYGMLWHINFARNQMRLESLFPFMLPYRNSVLDDWMWKGEKIGREFEMAVLYYDESGQILMQNGDYLTFVYTNEEKWNEGNTEVLGRGYVDLSKIDGGADAFSDFLDSNMQVSDLEGMTIHVFKLTGHFEGNAFHPVSVEEGRCRNMLTAQITEANRLRDSLVWSERLTVEDGVEQELETIYAWRISGMITEDCPLTINGVKFSGLSELLYADSVSEEDYSRKSLWDAVITNQYTNNKDQYGAYDFAIAVRFQPMKYAMIRLIPFYIVTLALILTGGIFVVLHIKKELISPLENMVAAISAGVPVSVSADWSEPRRLQQYVEDSYHELEKAKAEISRLNKALEYARSAEENRKQLVSNITHELKTPLAVIHSYAEGLQAGIAEDKSDKYLSVILEESEKMDALVLQMLDLSRLEAGKVKLAVEQFSLTSLTRSVVDMFSPMIENKGQQLVCEFSEDIQITADEGRMGQVITNLLSNAHKYAPPGGNIHLRIYQDEKCVYFYLKNTSKHLSDEVIKKVWDSFYRGEVSGREPGTGLGLALVKNIVELHRGVCTVKNTMDESVSPAAESVEFGVILPRK